MVRMKKWAIPLVGLGVLSLVVIPVYAHCGRCATSCKDILKAMDTGKVTLASAIAAAEAHSKGKAVAATSEVENGKLEVEVYCLVGDKLMEVAVDGTGKATGMKDAKSIPGHEEEKKAAPKPGG